jgi:flavin reductase (DIM6/NTAB) family NADH-FMN oxidoreductase RutF
MALDLREIRDIMGHFATGVTVVTTRDGAGSPFGLTVNAFTSLSLNPPLVVVCIDKAAQCYSCFEESKVFAVNVLSEDQEELIINSYEGGDHTIYLGEIVSANASEDRPLLFFKGKYHRLPLP